MSQLPAALSLPVDVSVKNSDLGLNERGTASHLDQDGLIASFPNKIPVGTVLFTTVDLRSINATTRGLIRVTGVRSLGEGAGFETTAEIVEINDQGREKIDRMLGRRDESPPSQTRNFAMDQMAVQPAYQREQPSRSDYQVTVADKPSYFEPAPQRARAEPTRSTKFWGSLGVTSYLIAFLIIVALFPKGRAVEMLIWGQFSHAVSRTWYWANHIGDVKLFDNGR